jgi:hypothetical protein
MLSDCLQHWWQQLFRQDGAALYLITSTEVGKKTTKDEMWHESGAWMYSVKSFSQLSRWIMKLSSTTWASV